MYVVMCKPEHATVPQSKGHEIDDNKNNMKKKLVSNLESENRTKHIYLSPLQLFFFVFLEFRGCVH